MLQKVMDLDPFDLGWVKKKGRVAEDPTHRGHKLEKETL